MIANVVITAAVLLFLTASANVMYQSYLEIKLKHIKELVELGADINELIK